MPRVAPYPGRQTREAAVRLHQELRWLLERRPEHDDNTHAARIGWLLPFRLRLRELQNPRTTPSRVLGDLLNHCESDMQSMVIWLLRWHVTPSNLWGVDHHIASGDSAVRRQVVRVLRRAKAHAAMERMAVMWPWDESVQQFARQPSREAYDTRLANYVRHHVDDTLAGEAIGPSRMPYWALNRFWFLSPPKDSGYLRAVLMRIQRWVHRRDVAQQDTPSQDRVR